MTTQDERVAPTLHGTGAMVVHAKPTLSSRIVGRLIEQATQHGLEPVTIRQLHRVTGLSPLQTDEAVRVSMHGYFGLWAEIIRATQNPGLPIELASTIAIEDFQLLGFLMMTSASGDEAIASLCRYLPLLTEGGEWSFESSDGAHVARCRRIVDAGELEERVANEFAVAQYVRVLRQVRRTELSPVSVTFKHRAPSCTKAHSEFFRCPIEWCAPVDSVSFDPRALQFTPPLANPSLHAFLRAQADEILALRGAPSSVAEQIREAIAVELPSGPPPLSRVARRLAMSERSLRRTLQREQQSFRQIVDVVRKARAIELLRSGQVSIGEVSARLGFSDPSAFSRAFKRWCGRSPQSFRPACRAH
jgi:AraC-like DNA-binding protein